MSQWHTVQDLADALKVSRQFVYDRIHNGDWPHKKIGKRTYRFSDEHLAQITEDTATPQRIDSHRRRRAMDAARRIA